MPGTHLVAIDSGLPEDDKPLREAIFTFTSGQTISTYDTPQWLTEDEIDQLQRNGFTVNYENED